MDKREKSDKFDVAEEEKAKRAAELVIANEEKADRAAELVIAKKEKQDRADELIIANKEKAKRADELIIAKKEKADHADELIIADAEKAARAAELVIAKKEKQDRADELIIANKELTYQNEEKAKRVAELIIANEEKEKRAEELITANKELSQLLQLDADKNRFISILAHDLKSPFNGLLGLSEILMEDIHKLDIDEIEKIVNDINKSAKTSFKLLEDILKWVGTQSGKIPFERQIFSFTDICKDIIEIFNQGIKTKKITINYLKTDGINIFADINMFKAVLRNLVSNAIKFTNKGGAINITAEQIDSNVTISVSDNGIGIAPAGLEKLFDIAQFISTNGTSGETGTGLGLLLCKEFVGKHGGKIWVESEEGKGSVFYFTIPNNNNPDEVNVVASEEADSNITNLKILITDDDEASRKFLGILVKMLGKEILYAQNGLEAVVACKDNPDINLILMDIKMPEMDGFEATRQIRQSNKDVIIIVQSAYTDSGEKEKAIEAGCNDFISKPINKTFLKELIKKHLYK